MTNPLVGHVLGSHSHVLISYMIAWGLVGHVMSSVAMTQADGFEKSVIENRIK